MGADYEKTPGEATTNDLEETPRADISSAAALSGAARNLA
jgi:hypothetical protein